MLSNVISIGDKIDLRRISYRKAKEIEEYETKIYVSQLLEYNSNNEALIAMPIVSGRIIPLTVGDHYHLCFYTKKGLFQCKVVITNRSKQNNIHTLTVTFLSDFEKYQRRSYYRLDCVLDIEYRILSTEELQWMQKFSDDKHPTQEEQEQYTQKFDEIANLWEEGTAIDISGGGMRFISSTLYEPSDKLRIKLFLEDQGKIQEQVVLASVISSARIPNKTGSIEHRVKFLKISNEQRETIIKFIFQEQRRIRRKEKGLE